MPATANLLKQALQIKTKPEWARTLGLERSALHKADTRGHLSPAMAFAIAEEMGQDAREWALIAAAESEKNSACKTRMMKALSGARKLYLSALSAARSVVRKRVNYTKDSAPCNAG